MSVQISDQDRGYADVVRRIRQLRAPRSWIKTGVSDAPHTPSGMPTDEIGAIHEFGLGRPQRSFLRAWADDKTRMNALSNIVERVLTDFIMGHTTLADALKGIGAWTVANVRQRMRLGLTPPLDRKTVDRKVRDGAALPGYPLLDTLQLEEAITYETSQ